MQSLAKSILIVVILFAAAYVGYMVYLGISINKSNNEGHKELLKEIYQQKLAGLVYLQNPQKLNCTLFMDVLSNNRKDIESIQLCPCRNHELDKFVSDGDSISKAPNTYEAYFIKKNGVSKMIELPLCK